MIENNVWIKLVVNSYIYATEFFFDLFGKGDFKSNHALIIFVFSKYLVRKPSFIRVEISWKCTMVVYRKSLQQIELGLRHIFT